MASIFISYRRDDTEGHAGRLLDELRKRLGTDGVFMDMEGIGLGLDFRQVIEEQLSLCKVVLALIGRRWHDTRDGSGVRRLEKQDDVLRFEIATAIKRGITIVPVLMHGARLPEAPELPEDLRPLLKLNAFELRHDKWSSDTKLLMERLVSIVPDLADCSRSTTPILTSTSIQVWLGSVVATAVTYEILYLTLDMNDSFLFVAWMVLGISLGIWHAARVPPNVVRDTILGFAIALSAGIGMSVVGMVYGEPFLPQNEPEWQYGTKHMVTIMLGFIAGNIIPRLGAKTGR